MKGSITRTKPLLATCNAGCNQTFEITSMLTISLGRGIEKTYFKCSHCDYEYVAFYTDREIRSLQEKMRELHKQFAEPFCNHDKVAKRESELKLLIKKKMDELRARYQK